MQKDNSLSHQSKQLERVGGQFFFSSVIPSYIWEELKKSPVKRKVQGVEKHRGMEKKGN